MPPSITLSRGVTSRELKLKAAAAAFFDRESPSPSFTYVDKKEKIGGRFLADQLCRNLFSTNPPSQAVPKKTSSSFDFRICFFFFFSTVIIFGTTDPRHRIGITNIRPSIKLLFIRSFSIFFLPPLFLWGSCGCFLAFLLSCMGNRNLHGNKGAFLKEQKEGKEWHGTGRFVVEENEQKG